MSIYDSLNPEQCRAVQHFEGPLLILAGAGSGKTRVLTHRVAWLIEEKGIRPWNIMAITFTNKAAGEMRERVERMLGSGSPGVWVTTFHSTCVRILRRYIDRIGYGPSFTIYDSDDQKSVIKEICRRLNVDTKLYKERYFMGAISAAKDELIGPEEYAQKTYADFQLRRVAEVYREYQRELRSCNALDFDDLIFRTVELFQQCPDVLEAYQERFRFIMVDEYQDTNTAQFQLIRLLASKYRNLCVVGDDDQSIYKFRGANIQNILNFEEFFPDTEVIRLEQNYRSTQNILDAANEVIRHNEGRKPKTLWTANGAGGRVRFRQFLNAFEEAEFVAGTIAAQVRTGGWKYGDCAVLYRTNAQSRMFEEKFLLANIPYKIVGGVNFYARKEIKDVLAYLKTIANGRDDLAVRRIINIPRRGVGATTISRVQEYAEEHDISFYGALREAERIPGVGRAAAKLQGFVSMIQTFRSKEEFYTVRQMIEDVLEATGYIRELEAEGTDEAEDRIDNIDELLSKAEAYDESRDGKPHGLDGFLEEVALVADIDELEEDPDHVLMMTLHSAKGLEFPVVFLVGMEDGMFPSYRSISSEDPQDIEEERRLCYVGITRAMRELILTAARMRMVRGEVHYNQTSRFVSEIPEQMLLTERDEEPKRAAGQRPQEGVESKRAAGQRPQEDGRPQGMFGAGKSGQNGRTPYQQARDAFRSKVFVPQQFQVKKADGLDYGPGDRVRHVKFGVGTVKNIVEGGRDYEVTVEFDRAGVKKMFASFARLEKVN